MKFWESYIVGVSDHTTKMTAGKAIFDKFTDLLQKVDGTSVRSEYKVWIYENYFLSSDSTSVYT